MAGEEIFYGSGTGDPSVMFFAVGGILAVGVVIGAAYMVYKMISN